jgi:phage protein U
MSWALTVNARQTNQAESEQRQGNGAPEAVPCRGEMFPAQLGGAMSHVLLPALAS